MSMLWKKLGLSASELSLARTLVTGQSFTWRETGHNEYSTVLLDRIVSVKEEDGEILYGTLEADTDNTVLAKLQDYFQVQHSLKDSYEFWSSRDANFKKKAVLMPGVRLLRQDPEENLMSFICSSNNNIPRITQLVTKLCQYYGKPIGILDHVPEVTFHSFPDIKDLARPGVEEELRSLGFGYRAKYLHDTARFITEREEGTEWLHQLRKASYKDAKSKLLTLSGVGPKVADCILLMSLDKRDAIPVDTHVWQIAKRDYKLQSSTAKTLTTSTYDAIGGKFREIFGEQAGWAHSVLFTAELKPSKSSVKRKTESDDDVAVEVKEETDLGEKENDIEPEPFTGADETSNPQDALTDRAKRWLKRRNMGVVGDGKGDGMKEKSTSC